MFEFENRFPRAAVEAVESTASSIWETLIYAMEKLGESGTFEDLEDVVYEYMTDGSHVCGLDLCDQLSVCQYLADDYGLPGPDVKEWSDLRSSIERTADLCIVNAAQAKCIDTLERLRDLVEELELNLSDVTRGNSFGYFVHRSERDEADARVYEYRGIEGGEIDVDVWEIEMVPGFDVYLNVFLEKEGRG